MLMERLVHSGSPRRHRFYLALAARPGSGDLAAAMLRIDGLSLRIEIALYRGSGLSPRVLWTSDRFAPTPARSILRWSRDGTYLAAVQSNRLLVLRNDEIILQRSLPREIRGVAFDDFCRLFVLSEQLLHRIEPLGHSPKAEVLHRNAVAILPGVRSIYVGLKEKGHYSIGEIREGISYRICKALNVEQEVELKAAPDGTLFLGLRDAPESGSTRLKVIRCVDQAVLVDRTLTAGLSEPRVEWVPVTAAAVAVQGGIDNVRSLWMFHEGTGRSRLTPEQHQLANAWWNPSRTAFVLSGRRADEGPRRMTAVYSRDGIQLRMMKGATQAAMWQDDRTFFAASERRQSWQLSRHRVASPGSAARTQRLGSVAATAAGPSPRKPEYVLLSTHPRPPTSIIYLTGPHRPFPAGPDESFYHFAIRSELLRWVPRGVQIVGINRAGSRQTRRSRASRVACTNWSDGMGEALFEALKLLHRQGIDRIGVVATSLGVLAALPFLAQVNVSAGIFINPVYTCQLPVLTPWRHIFKKGPTLEECLGKYAPGITSPLLVIHGMLDEVSPSFHSSEFVAALNSDTSCRYVSVPDEGHVFQTAPGWRTLLGTLRSFLREHLGG
jgi:pimeloyl-ACP methyl ester carboxylesterase